MKISELIAKLQAVQAKQGDLTVLVSGYEFGCAGDFVIGQTVVMRREDERGYVEAPGTGHPAFSVVVLGRYYPS